MAVRRRKEAAYIKGDVMAHWRHVVDSLMHQRDAKRVDRRRRSMVTGGMPRALMRPEELAAEPTNNQLERSIEARRRGHMRRTAKKRDEHQRRRSTGGVTIADLQLAALEQPITALNARRLRPNRHKLVTQSPAQQSVGRGDASGFDGSEFQASPAARIVKRRQRGSAATSPRGFTLRKTRRKSKVTPGMGVTGASGSPLYRFRTAKHQPGVRIGKRRGSSPGVRRRRSDPGLHAKDSAVGDTKRASQNARQRRRSAAAADDLVVVDKQEVQTGQGELACEPSDGMAASNVVGGADGIFGSADLDSSGDDADGIHATTPREPIAGDESCRLGMPVFRRPATFRRFSAGDSSLSRTEMEKLVYVLSPQLPRHRVRPHVGLRLCGAGKHFQLLKKRDLSKQKTQTHHLVPHPQFRAWMHPNRTDLRLLLPALTRQKGVTPTESMTLSMRRASTLIGVV